MKVKSVWLALLLIALVGGSWLLIYPLSPQKNARPVISHPDQPDAILFNPHYARYDANGNMTSQLKAAQMTHFSDKDSAKLIAPHLMLYQNNQSAWDIKANKATSMQDNQKITLIDNVVVIQLPKISESTEMTLQTTRLTVFPKRRLATTKQPVQIVQGGLSMNGIGMTADLQNHVIHILSSVRGQYEAQ